MQYKFLPSGLRAEICCNGEKKDFQVESGLSRDLFASTGTYVHKKLGYLANIMGYYSRELDSWAQLYFCP